MGLILTELERGGVQLPPPPTIVAGDPQAAAEAQRAKEASRSHVMDHGL